MASDAAAQEATSCEREANRLGNDYRDYCFVPVVEPLFEEAEAKLAAALEAVRGRVGPDCQEALGRAILEVEAGGSFEEPTRAIHACEADAASSGTS